MKHRAQSCSEEPFGFVLLKSVSRETLLSNTRFRCGVISLRVWLVAIRKRCPLSANDDLPVFGLVFARRKRPDAAVASDSSRAKASKCCRRLECCNRTAQLSPHRDSFRGCPSLQRRQRSEYCDMGGVVSVEKPFEGSAACAVVGLGEGDGGGAANGGVQKRRKAGNAYCGQIACRR